MLWFLMAYKKKPRPKAANDNQHDQIIWNVLYDFVDHWLRKYNIPRDQWNFNRSIHYTYERHNRPWLDKDTRYEDMIKWLFWETQALGFSTAIHHSEKVST